MSYTVIHSSANLVAFHSFMGLSDQETIFPIYIGKLGRFHRENLANSAVTFWIRSDPRRRVTAVRGTVQGMLVPWLENSQETSQKLGINNLKHLVPWHVPKKNIDDVVTYAGKPTDYTRMVAEQEWLLVKPHVFKHTIWDDLANTNGDR